MATGWESTANVSTTWSWPELHIPQHADVCGASVRADLGNRDVRQAVIAEVAYRDGRRTPAVLRKRAPRYHVVECSVAKAQVDTIRSDQVRDPIAIEVTDGDRSVAGKFAANGLKRRLRRSQEGGDLVTSTIAKTLHFNEVIPGGDMQIDEVVAGAGAGPSLCTRG